MIPSKKPKIRYPCKAMSKTSGRKCEGFYDEGRKVPLCPSHKRALHRGGVVWIDENDKEPEDKK